MSSGVHGEDGAASVEETFSLRLKFSDRGLVAAAATSARDGRLLMIAWMNEDAVRLTLETGVAHYWSRSRRAIWRKGETSGNVQVVQEVRVDCDQDALELVVEEAGPACHTDRRSCFYRRVELDENGSARLVFNDV